MLNYIEVFEDDYAAVFWIDASSKDRLEADYKRIHNLLLHPSLGDVDVKTCVSEIRQWCQRKPGKHLFVLDSADSIEDAGSDDYVELQSYIVDAASVDVVITTRVQSAKDMTELEAVQVAELTPDEARDIFIRRMSLQNPDSEIKREIDAVTAELGHFALAVSLAAAYVASTRRLKDHPANYLVEYSERKKTLLARKPKKHVDQYGESVLTTWETTYASVSSRCPEACNLLTLIAFLSSSDIFPELFGPDYGTASDILASVICIQASAMPFQETIDNSFETLELYSFLQWNNQTKAFSMHKLVHAWSIGRLETTEQATFCLAAWRYLKHLFPVTEKIPAMSGRLVSHITTCFTSVRALCHGDGQAVEPFVASAVSLADNLRSTGRSDSAYELQSFAHEYHERRHSIDPMAYAQSSLALSLILQHQYKYDAAEELLRYVLDDLKEPLSIKGHQTKVSCQYMLAMILARHHRKLKEAEQMFRDILNLRDEGELSPEVNVQSNLASVLMKQRRNSEAEAIFKNILHGDEALTDRRRVSFTRCLGRALRSQKKFAEAEVVARQACEDMLVHGLADLRLQIPLLDLGEVKLAQQEFEEAVSILRPACDAIAIPYHVAHLECLASMGCALRHLQRYDEGVSFYTKALDGYARMLGTDHECTRMCSESLDECRALLARRVKTEEQRERKKDRGADHREEDSAG